MRFPIQTARLRIEPLQIADLDAFVAYRQDPKIAKFQSWDPTYSREQGLRLIESQQGLVFPPHGEWLQIGVYLRDATNLIGDLAVHRIDSPSLQVELGFTISGPNQNKGYAKEAVAGLLDELNFQDPHVIVFAYPDSRNHASVALLLSLGFRDFPSKSWTEHFKGETVRVLHFELR